MQYQKCETATDCYFYWLDHLWIQDMVITVSMWLSSLHISLHNHTQLFYYWTIITSLTNLNTTLFFSFPTSYVVDNILHNTSHNKDIAPRLSQRTYNIIYNRRL